MKDHILLIREYVTLGTIHDKQSHDSRTGTETPPGSNAAHSTVRLSHHKQQSARGLSAHTKWVSVSEAMINPDSKLKSKDISLPTKVHLIKAMIFPVVIYGCEKVKVKVARLCLTLCDPRDYPVHGILQARLLEWVNFPFSRGSSPNPGIKPRSPAV